MIRVCGYVGKPKLNDQVWDLEAVVLPDIAFIRGTRGVEGSKSAIHIIISENQNCM